MGARVTKVTRGQSDLKAVHEREVFTVKRCVLFCLLAEGKLAIGRNWMLMLDFSVCITTASAIRRRVLLGSLWMITMCSLIFSKTKLIIYYKTRRTSSLVLKNYCHLHTATL